MENRDNCNCKTYQPLELTREHITERIKKNNNIHKTLDKLTDSEDGNVLYRCSICGQFWQKSNAWNWGGKDYFFQVPKIAIEDWRKEQFMSPADMLIYSVLMTEYFEKNKFVESENVCRREECDNKSIVGNVLCIKHFVENIQKIGNLPERPKGRIFEPYSFEIWNNMCCTSEQ